jgi:hypothetical protein
MSRMNYMRIWKRHRLTSHTYSRFVVALVYFFFILKTRCYSLSIFKKCVLAIPIVAYISDVLPQGSIYRHHAIQSLQVSSLRVSYLYTPA